MKFGAVFWMQGAAWPRLREAWEAAGRAGLDSLWTEDHLLADAGDWRQPKFEGWAALAALAPLTQTPRVGVLVTAVAFRNPGHVAKLATTLDHITDGRLVLGMGGGHFQREHEAFGFDFGATPGARLDRLDESLGLIRRLLDGELVTHHGRYYDFVDALCEPRPIQPHVPFMIGGSGPKKTLAIVARHADEWNKSGGSPEVVAESLDILRERCAEVGSGLRDDQEVGHGLDAHSRQSRATRWRRIAQSGSLQVFRPRRIGAPSPYLRLPARSNKLPTPFEHTKEWESTSCYCRCTSLTTSRRWRGCPSYAPPSSADAW